MGEDRAAVVDSQCRVHGIVGLRVVDYLQLLTGSGRRNDGRVQEITEISQGLKALAKESRAEAILALRNASPKPGDAAAITIPAIATTIMSSSRVIPLLREYVRHVCRLDKRC